MDRRAVNILLIVGLALAVMYVFVYFSGYGSGSSGAFAAAPGAAHGFLAAVVAVLAMVGIWQGRKQNK